MSKSSGEQRTCKVLSGVDLLSYYLKIVTTSLLFFLLLALHRVPAASKNFMHDCIYLWSWSATKAQKPDRKSLEVSAVVLAQLQWTSTEIPYLSLNTCPGRWSHVSVWRAGRAASPAPVVGRARCCSVRELVLCSCP